MTARAVALSALRVTSLAVIPWLLACGGPIDEEPAEHAEALSGCMELPSRLIFTQTFNRPLLGWRSFTTEPTDPGHSWSILRVPQKGGHLSSDPTGSIMAAYQNRIDTPPISLEGKTRGNIRFRTRFQHNGSFQVYIDDDMTRMLIADFGPQSPSWPDEDCVEIPIPSRFIGQEVRLSFVMAGGAGGGAGAEIDNLRVAARSCNGETNGTPVLPNSRPFTIQRCSAAAP